jgi:hypothetical protein
VQLIWSNYYRNGHVPGQVKKGSFLWKDNMKLLNCFKGIAQVTVEKGDTVLFWKDSWNGKILNQVYPNYFHSQIMRTSLCRWFYTYMSFIISLTCLYLRRPSHNSAIWMFTFKLCDLMIALINGNIYGEMAVTKHQKLIIIW